MPHQEGPQPPSPEKPPSERTQRKDVSEADSKREQAEGVLMKLNARIGKFKDAILASMILGQIASSAIEIVKEAAEQEHKAAELSKRPQPRMERPGGSPASEITLDAGELAAFEEEATPEDIRLILETLPPGYADDIEAVRFKDEDMPMHESYGPKLAKGGIAAWAEGGGGAERTVVVFWRGAKSETAEAVWNGTFLHEVAHGNDWETDADLTPGERAELKRRVYERVQAEDRYLSDYVESIENADAQTQLDEKAKEYWAEINEAYLQGKDLPPADAALVKAQIEKNAPGFDRDAALEAREAALEKMKAEKAVAEYGRLPAAERAKLELWIERHAKAEAPETTAVAQREGRRELVAYLREVAVNDSKSDLALAYVEYCGAREAMLEARKHPEDVAAAGAAARALTQALEELGKRRADLPASDADAVIARIDGIVDARDLVIGEHRGARMDQDEYQELFGGDDDADEMGEQILLSTDWALSDPDYSTLGTDRLIQDFVYPDSNPNVR